ncbi:MAG TPA: Asp-tRNA(Asn)/Glu-tRNA(Gln) amidotransferase subunit GatB, partial [Chitinophagales bacterium]|nr:Asp-tRNA(Asn)/Glu-tRNA(Gln) amidotransferase subunit GatB [Chitinophagales bacterium]
MSIYEQYEIVVGLEVHAQLNTQTKIFAPDPLTFGAIPNTQVSFITLGHPGTLPVLNKAVIAKAVRMGIATHCSIQKNNQFSRKNYFYPDLPKGYQISQFDTPICYNGYVTVKVGDASRTIRINRIHLEEDAGKSLHEGFPDSAEKTYLDFNRCGVPLVEIVTRPEMSTASEAVEFVQNLRTLLQYLEVCDGNMEEGNLRCDANLSVRRTDSKEAGTKTEVKNINSFRFLARALDYEAKRQVELLEKGERIIQETRGWDAAGGRTVPQRSKEEAHDYRYFPEPDLPPLIISEGWITEIEAELPELPQAKRER